MKLADGVGKRMQESQRRVRWGYLLVQGLVVLEQRLEGLQHLHLTGDP